MLRIVRRSPLHMMHVGLLIAIPILRVLLGILRHHRRHMLRIVWLILRMWPHGRLHGCIRAILPPSRGLHGHVLPIWMMILLHDGNKVAFRTFLART